MVESSIRPSFCKSLEFFFAFNNGEPALFDDPGYPAEAEFIRIEHNGTRLNEYDPDLEEILFDNLWDRVELEIMQTARR